MTAQKTGALKCQIRLVSNVHVERVIRKVNSKGVRFAVGCGYDGVSLWIPDSVEHRMRGFSKLVSEPLVNLEKLFNLQ